MNDRYQEILDALGGPANVRHLDACISCLRVTAQDLKLINEEKLKVLGALALTARSNDLQAVFGTESDHIREQVQRILNAEGTSVKVNRKVILTSPLSGKVISLSDVPDKVFSEKLLGEGFAIDPTEGRVVAPADATVVSIFKTNHAIGLETETGVEILIHIGIDTVKMNGEGFEALVQYGQKVKAGQDLIKFDLNLVRSRATSTISPVIVTNMDRVLKIHQNAVTSAQAGEEIASLELKA